MPARPGSARSRSVTPPTPTRAAIGDRPWRSGDRSAPQCGHRSSSWLIRRLSTTVRHRRPQLRNHATAIGTRCQCGSAPRSFAIGSELLLGDWPRRLSIGDGASAGGFNNSVALGRARRYRRQPGACRRPHDRRVADCRARRCGQRRSAEHGYGQPGLVDAAQDTSFNTSSSLRTFMTMRRTADFGSRR